MCLLLWHSLQAGPAPSSQLGLPATYHRPGSMQPLSQQKAWIINAQVRDLDLLWFSPKMMAVWTQTQSLGPDNQVSLLPLSQPLSSLKQQSFME